MQRGRNNVWFSDTYKSTDPSHGTSLVISVDAFVGFPFFVTFLKQYSCDVPKC